MLSISKLILENQTTRTRVGVFIIQNGNILVADASRTYEYKYFFPGGGIEPGETYKDAAVRESKEEIGVVPKNIKMINHPKNPYKYCGLKEHGFRYDCSELIWVTAEPSRRDASLHDSYKIEPIEMSANDVKDWLKWCINKTRSDLIRNTKYQLDLVMLNHLIQTRQVN